MTDQGASTGAAGQLRPKRRAIWLVIAAVTAVVLTAPALQAGAGFLFRHTRDSRSVFGRPISVLRIEVPAGEVSIQAGRPGQTRIAKQVRWSTGAPPAVLQAWHRRTLTISSTKCGGGPFSGRCDIRLGIRVPATVAVWITSAHGQISMRGLNGPVHAQVSAGMVHLDNVRGQTQVQVGAGAVYGVALGSGRVDAAVLSGSLRLAFARPPRRVSASVGTGSVTVVVPAGSRYRVHATPGPDVSRQVNHALVSGSSQRLITLSATTGTLRLAASCCQTSRRGGGTR